MLTRRELELAALHKTPIAAEQRVAPGTFRECRQSDAVQTVIRLGLQEAREEAALKILDS